MSWTGDKIEKFRQMPGPCFFLYVTAKFLGGLGLGVLLSGWLPMWSGWLFRVVGLLIAIPSAAFILKK